LAFSSFGVRVGIRATPELLQNIPTSLIPGSRIVDPVGLDASFLFQEAVYGNHVRYELYDQSQCLGSATDFREAVRLIEMHVQEAIAMQSPSHVFVHAGVVGWNGQAVLIPGRSYCGKSTLVMALTELGATYFSDEYAVLDQEGFVHPYLRELRLRDDVRGAGEGKQNAPVLGAEPPKPLSVGLVLVSEYTVGAVWQPSRLTCGEALFSLIENTVAIRAQPEASMRTLRHLAVNARAYKTVRGEAGLAAAAMLKLLRPQTRN
jgi:hypothetical protein